MLRDNMRYHHILKILLMVPLVVVCNVSYAGAIIQSVGVVPAPFDVTTGVKVVPVVKKPEANIEFEYRWFVNGNEDFFEKTNHYPGLGLKRGDILSVEITPVNEQQQRLTPYSVTTLNTENARPVVTEPVSELLTERGYSLQISASDPDGDNLIYKLEQAPDGMTINSSTGEIAWPFESIPIGAFPVKVIVDDGHGGKVTQEFVLNLSEE
ncbi:Ig domain-containing protein [Pelovirga terrestris]|uniref:Putative Ig domain-containing protein n=1 Tax=Pelovirga terrestris TaxID=2771352 RepID=A0A8J6QJT7_9BACT|nr:Ig domain-containing protein [Pelovirga terrestris]MBD1399409.1 putative Ig domain-containing protein [Pelovirga terrestris]